MNVTLYGIMDKETGHLVHFSPQMMTSGYFQFWYVCTREEQTQDDKPLLFNTTTEARSVFEMPYRYIFRKEPHGLHRSRFTVVSVHMNWKLEKE